MSYTLDQFAADCRAALLKDAGPAGRELARQYTERACADPDFVSKHLGPDLQAERTILYQDPDLHFCILAHAYKGAKSSSPHDHGPSWAVYGQAIGVTEMTDWRLVEKPANGQPGKVEKAQTYPADAWHGSPIWRGRFAFAAARHGHPTNSYRGRRSHAGRARQI